MMIAPNKLEECNVDDEIRKLEVETAVRALNEQMWGGQRGPGLIHAIADLSKTVTKLSETVATISTDIHSENGVRSAIRELGRKADELAKDVTEFKTAKGKILWWLAGIGFCSVITFLRIGYQIGSGMGFKL